MLAGLRTRELTAFAAGLLSTASQPLRASADRGFVLAYRCGAVPDFHRVPFLISERAQSTSTGRSL